MSDNGRRTLNVCRGTGCESIRSAILQEALEREMKAQGLAIPVKRTGCHGLCERGPIVSVEPDGLMYVDVKEKDVADIVASLVTNEPVDRLIYHDPETDDPRPHYKDIKFYQKQKYVVMRHNRYIDPENIDEYIAVGGYQALQKALSSMTPEEVLEEVKRAGLRGRGGGGFPTARKWEASRRAEGQPKFLLANGDEGDPGAFMNCSLMEGNPHLLLEGMAISAYAIGAERGYIYVRAEYPLAVRRLGIALEQAKERGYLGENILGLGFSFDLDIKKGAGAFVCGESTALMASVMGRRGMPRSRPPQSAERGLWGKPTVLNNVETFANVVRIIEHGSDWFANIGVENNTGTKTFSLTGKVKNTGLVEVALGTTLGELIFDIGGGIIGDRPFKAAQTGGPSGGCVSTQHLDMPMDYESLTAAGAMMGSGGLVVMDEDTCMVDVARYFVTFNEDESCGKCAPCRLGTRRLREILERICAGEGTMSDLDTLQDLGTMIHKTTLCGLGRTAANPVLSTLRYFRPEYEAHVLERRCPAGVCKPLIAYRIDPELCTGCVACARQCPTGAVHGERKQVHSIDQAACIKCGACKEACKFDAVIVN